MPTVPDRASRVSNIGVAGSKSLAPRRNPGLVHAIVEFLKIRIDDDDAFRFLRFEHDLLVTKTEGGRGDRHPIFEARSSKLPVECDVVASNEQRHHDVRFGRLKSL